MTKDADSQAQPPKRKLGYRTTAIEALGGADLTGKQAVVTGEPAAGQVHWAAATAARYLLCPSPLRHPLTPSSPSSCFGLLDQLW